MANKIPNIVDISKLRFQIGELSKMTGVSTRQLRYWEQKKFIAANDRDADQEARVFDFRMYIKVTLIKRYLDEGYKLSVANEKSGATIKDALWFHNFFRNSFQGLETIDGKRAVNLGYFDQAQGKVLYGFNEDGKIRYEIRDAT
ncbi:MerR family transcriptional regulator [Paucilactobacillus kaifaensis]|uniref:MerR family transcriptional regulator n=1 Tax=Paucilactobacillus kaifaensis TaxID=2559921 RepID=UPI0010F783F3|nr:MerR family transcriptional regulator [Paucilactobacillus kaifaensis]